MISFTNRLALNFLALVAWSGIGLDSVVAQSRPLDKALDQMRNVIFGGERESTDAGIASDEREEETDVATGDSTPFGVDLRSIHLISDQSKVTMNPTVGSVPVTIEEGLPAPIGLDAQLEFYVGEPMSMALLSTIQKDIVVAWRDSDYPLIDVYFPEQNISAGKLQIVVKESVLGEKSFEGAVISRENYLIENLRINEGDRISRRVVESDIDCLNENPIRQVSLIYERGDGDGTSDIQLQVEEKEPFSAYVGFSNTGVDFTGEEECSFGFAWMNPGKQEHLIGYHFATDMEWEDLQAHSLRYEAFLPWRHTLSILAAHVSSESETAAPLNASGLSKQLSVEYRVPLARPKFNRAWRHYLTFAFDYKSTDTDLLFGGLTFFGNDVEVGQFRGLYEVRVPDEKGITLMSVGLVGSPGDMFSNNDDTSFGIARLGSEADYWYAIAEFERLQQLPNDFTLRVDLQARGSGDRLPSTELLLAGGYATVRGFDESLARGDSGILSTVELITPDFSIFPNQDDTWNGFIFWDAAVLDISDAVVGEVSPSLQSLGLGLNTRVGDRGFARAAYGWAVEDHGLPSGTSDGKFHFGLTLTY